MKLSYLIKHQHPDGSFGPFHSMRPDQPLTTEKALRRFYALNLTKNHPLVKKTLAYVLNCLQGNLKIPDRAEKVIHWKVFEMLMFSSWLKLFRYEAHEVKRIQAIWKNLIEASIRNNHFDEDYYQQVYHQTFTKNHPNERVIDPFSFYPVVLLQNCLDDKYLQVYFDMLMKKGIYYIYEKPLEHVPDPFDSNKTIRYLEAIKLTIPYCTNKRNLNFVLTWLNKQKDEAGAWNMHQLRPDGIIFPKTDDWRKQKHRRMDIQNYFEEVTSLLA